MSGGGSTSYYYGRREIGPRQHAQWVRIACGQPTDAVASPQGLTPQTFRPRRIRSHLTESPRVTSVEVFSPQTLGVFAFLGRFFEYTGASQPGDSATRPSISPRKDRQVIWRAARPLTSIRCYGRTRPVAHDSQPQTLTMSGSSPKADIRAVFRHGGLGQKPKSPNRLQKVRCTRP